ncbi:hypothetical protein OG689_24190 [Kitasatospora sp. NBC_00240]|uniref:hypothetical protein n=1 Tax=Kitasatospora sp. NBC_00240 TaxID=2903567 RepID=UPI0022537390|nr:hypothetical protein [Kitasatospora sp. NBC_00240]MCX5212343.1 hypothetical protein [Kitasatospora sp. NBC_00240]
MTATTNARATGVASIAAPALLGLYGGIRLLAGSRAPGPGWTAGHTALLAGLLLFVPVFAELRRLVAPRRPAGRAAANLMSGLAYAGLLASAGQSVIDLYVGARAADRAEQNRLFDQIQGHPGVLPAFYTVGPVLFHLGLLALLVTLAAGRARRVPVWSPVLVLAGTVLMAADLDLITIGAALWLAALAPLARRTGRAGRPAAAAL